MEKPHLEHEKQLSGIVAGVDEAGRGPLVGPVFAAAVIVDENNIIDGINDSKKISPTKRYKIYEQIITSYIYAIGSASVVEIDQLNILNATKLAMQRAIALLPVKPTNVLIDGLQSPAVSMPVKCIIGGDTISLSIAAASIVAKVSRDQLMDQLHEDYPLYNWKQNKGYGTKEHILAIKKHGASKYHRQTFAPVKNMSNN